MNKEDSLKEKFKQAIISTVKVISDDYLIDSKKKKITEEDIKINNLENKILKIKLTIDQK